jgi:hypothetical protein
VWNCIAPPFSDSKEFCKLWDVFGIWRNENTIFSKFNLPLEVEDLARLVGSKWSIQGSTQLLILNHRHQFWVRRNL